ncbi:MAG: hypothetical protein KUG82_12340 [Pseudomonadales bacterium]|nr:hypothetical protein [Pseudomonadales bacterium]
MQSVKADLKSIAVGSDPVGMNNLVCLRISSYWVRLFVVRNDMMYRILLDLSKIRVISDVVVVESKDVTVGSRLALAVSL